MAPTRFTIVLATLLLALGVVFVSPAHALLRGLVQQTWVGADQATQESILNDYSRYLHAQVVRIAVTWPRAEPQQGVYDETYLGNIEAAVDAARLQGLRVMMLVYQVPQWASDQRFWNDPPFPSTKPGYQPNYPMRLDALADFRRLAATLAARFAGKVSWYECWCEPNIYPYFYPQQYGSDKEFAARTYARYLRAFYKGIKQGAPRALVLGGVTGPWGMDDDHTTSPLTFARQLRSFKAQRYMDGYSHHPYPVGNPMPAPNVAPQFPQYNIDLYNVKTLMRVFPRTQFYFTEYGYTTHDEADFGGGMVTRRQQAEYLTMSFRIAARLPRVRMLLWFQWQDQPLSMGWNGHYFGLRDSSGARKPSWFAFRDLARKKWMR